MKLKFVIEEIGLIAEGKGVLVKFARWNDSPVCGIGIREIISAFGVSPTQTHTINQGRSCSIKVFHHIFHITEIPLWSPAFLSIIIR